MLLPGQKRIEQTRVPRRNRVLKKKKTSVAYITLLSSQLLLIQEVVKLVNEATG